MPHLATTCHNSPQRVVRYGTHNSSQQEPTTCHNSQQFINILPQLNHNVTTSDHNLTKSYHNSFTIYYNSDQFHSILLLQMVIVGVSRVGKASGVEKHQFGTYDICISQCEVTSYRKEARSNNKNRDGRGGSAHVQHCLLTRSKQ